MPPVCSFWQFFFSVHFVWMESFVMCKLRRAEKRWFDDKMASLLWGFVPFTRQVNSWSELGTKITWVTILFFPLPPLSPSSFSQSSHFAVASVITDNNKPREASLWKSYRRLNSFLVQELYSGSTWGPLHFWTRLDDIGLLLLYFAFRTLDICTAFYCIVFFFSESNADANVTEGAEVSCDSPHSHTHDRRIKVHVKLRYCSCV